MFRKTTFQKRSKFGYYMSFPVFFYVKEKPRDFICALQWKNLSFGSFLSIWKSEMSMLLKEYKLSFRIALRLLKHVIKRCEKLWKDVFNQLNEQVTQWSIQLAIINL